jgi:hypothetical protein
MELNLLHLCLLNPNLPDLALLHFRLHPTTEKDRGGDSCTGTKIHEGLPATFLESQFSGVSTGRNNHSLWN